MERWSTARYLSSLHLHNLVADALLVGFTPTSPEAEHEYLKGLTDGDVTKLLKSNLQDELILFITTAIKQLRSAYAVDAVSLHDKFVQEGAAFTLAYGDLRTFFSGRNAQTARSRTTASLPVYHCDS